MKQSGNVNVNRNSAQLDKEPVVLPVVGVEPPRGREVKPPRCPPDPPPGRWSHRRSIILHDIAVVVGEKYVCRNRAR